MIHNNNNHNNLVIMIFNSFMNSNDNIKNTNDNNAY